MLAAFATAFLQQYGTDRVPNAMDNVVGSGAAAAVAAQTSDGSVQPKHDGLSISSDKALAVTALLAQVHNLHQQLGTTELDRKQNAVTECGQQAMQASAVECQHCAALSKQ